MEEELQEFEDKLVRLACIRREISDLQREIESMRPRLLHQLIANGIFTCAFCLDRDHDNCLSIEACEAQLNELCYDDIQFL